MKRIVTLVAAMCAASLFAKEKLVIQVADPDGNPVSHAMVKVKTMNKIIVFGSDRAADFDTYSVTTDEKGRAELRFDCVTRCFSWGATADGYYDGSWKDDEFEGSETVSRVGKVLISFKEHEKELKTTLWPKKNSQPMHVRWLRPALQLPVEQGRYGFDLKEGDWVAPVGCGLVADVFYVHEGESQCIEMPDGGYVERMADGCSPSAVYCVNTNREFVTKIQLRKKMDGVVPVSIAIDADECLVIRTRVTKDEVGNVIKANYAEIRGPMVFDNELRFRQIIYNPRQNDLNLEWDNTTNLSKPRRVSLN